MADMGDDVEQEVASQDDPPVSQRSAGEGGGDIPFSQQTCSSDELNCVGCCASSKHGLCPVECLKTGGSISIEKCRKTGTMRVKVENKRGVKPLKVRWGKTKNKKVKTRGGGTKKKNCKAGVWCLNCLALYKKVSGRLPRHRAFQGFDQPARLEGA